MNFRSIAFWLGLLAALLGFALVVGSGWLFMFGTLAIEGHFTTLFKVAVALFVVGLLVVWATSSKSPLDGPSSAVWGRDGEPPSTWDEE